MSSVEPTEFKEISTLSATDITTRLGEVRISSRMETIMVSWEMPTLFKVVPILFMEIQMQLLETPMLSQEALIWFLDLTIQFSAMMDASCPLLLHHPQPTQPLLVKFVRCVNKKNRQNKSNNVEIPLPKILVKDNLLILLTHV